ncbi:DNA mismatch repair protein MutS [Chitinophaga sp.]|uniref:MutS-related protein n=1 Tax=Chitinophaga sp. TaxID=1869181 RepID=UPI0031D29CFA
MNTIQSYEDLQKIYQGRLDTLLNKQRLISFTRLLSIIFSGVALYYYFKEDQYWLLGAAGIFLVLFFLLVKQFGKNKERVDHLRLLIKINKDEIAYVEQGILNFEAGEEFIDPEHAYTFDLDVFGSNSLFQHMNRTGTLIGKQALAQRFIHQQVTGIHEEQAAVAELADHIEWRQHFTAFGRLHVSTEKDRRSFNDWLNAPQFYLKKKINVILFYLLPAITLATLLIMLLTTHKEYYFTFLTFFLLNLLLVGLNLKRFKKEYLALEGVSKIFNTYSHLLKAIESESFQSSRLQALRQSIFTEHTSAGKAISQLARVLSKFDSQQNIFGSLLLNGLLLDALHTMLSLEKWRSRYAQNVPLWMEVIATWDSLNSLANFYCNNRSFVFPQLSNKPMLEIKDAGHPLIRKDKRVYNDISFQEGKFTILTGSNMSGKSTFLRTIGVNLLLARMGAPLCASSCTLYPFEIFVSMKINDSLQNSESLFFAELRRLRRIIDQVETRQPTFVILDEILRGTNSNDKHRGTSSLIRKLAAFKVYGIIATHDLTISEMVMEYPLFLRNQCFEVEIDDKRLHFDYKLKDGICQKMSAVYLMEQMNII